MTPGFGLNPVDRLKRRVYGASLNPVAPMPGEIDGRRYDLMLQSLYDPSQVLPGSDEEKISSLLMSQGKTMLPYEYRGDAGPKPTLEQAAGLTERPATPAPGVTPIRPELARALLADQPGIEAELSPPVSWKDLIAEPIMSFLGEADVLKYLPVLPALGMVVNARGRTVPGTVVGKSKKYIPAQASIEREAQRGGLEDLTRPFTRESNRIMTAAEKKLRWQEWERPRLEEAYGELRPATAGASKRRLQQNVPAAVESRVANVQDFLRQPTEIWTPPEYGIFDRRLIADAMEGFPDVSQTRFPRSTPARGNTRYVDEIYQDPRNRQLIIDQIKRGLPLGGETFYASLWPVKVEWMSRGGDPAQFDKWVDAIAPGSARNSIINENAVGNLLMSLHYQGIPLTDDNVKRAMREFKGQFGTGLPLMPVHRKGTARVLEQGVDLRDLVTRNLTQNYKIPTYAAQKRGDFLHSWTGDVHEATGETFGSTLHPYFTEAGGFGKLEYGPAEGHMLDIAREVGVPGGTAQAGRWFGGGEKTGLLSPRGDALDMLEQQAAYTLHTMGRPTDPASVRDYIMGLIAEGGTMMPWQSPRPMPEHRIVQPGSARPRRSRSR